MTRRDELQSAPSETEGAGSALLLTPTGRDAVVIDAYLHEAGIPSHICPDMAAFCARLGEAAAGLIAEETLTAQTVYRLIAALQRQPVWSDVPLVILTTRDTPTVATWQFMQPLEAVGNIILLERPLHPMTLLSTLRLAMRARRRQHDNRRLHDELEERVAERTAELEEQTQRLQLEVTERERAQEALFQQEKLAALGTLLANVAHELNNPLAVAAMQLESLEEEADSTTRSDDLETLRQAIERCQSVVQSFLSLARRQAPTRSAVALNAIIGDIFVLLEHALEADGVVIERHLPETLPPVWADSHQLHHVIANLVTNAHHALRQTASPRRLTLTTSVSSDRRQVTLEVTDNGPGVPEALQRRIFDPFFTTKPQGEGTGLGLPLCQNIIESHGGTLSLVSQPGRGATVRVTLPISMIELPCPEAPADPPAPSQSQGEAILLIDDEVGVQKALSRLLRRRGHEVTTANNGWEGLAALETRSYDVILCDMRMPDLDGPGFYYELEQRRPDLLSRLIFLTGDSLSPAANGFFAQVDCPRLIKPYKMQDIRRVIEQVLEAQ